MSVKSNPVIEPACKSKKIFVSRFQSIDFSQRRTLISFENFLYVRSSRDVDETSNKHFQRVVFSNEFFFLLSSSIFDLRSLLFDNRKVKSNKPKKDIRRSALINQSMFVSPSRSNHFLRSFIYLLELKTKIDD